MIQTVLMFLAPAQEASAIPPVGPVPGSAMATRLGSGQLQDWQQSAGTILAVAANTLGLILFLAGLGLVLRLAEVLLS